MTTTPRRLVTPERREEDIAETSLRPQRLGSVCRWSPNIRNFSMC